MGKVKDGSSKKRKRSEVDALDAISTVAKSLSVEPAEAETVKEKHKSKKDKHSKSKEKKDMKDKKEKKHKKHSKSTSDDDNDNDNNDNEGSDNNAETDIETVADVVDVVDVEELEDGSSKKKKRKTKHNDDNGDDDGDDDTEGSKKKKKHKKEKKDKKDKKEKKHKKDKKDKKDKKEREEKVEKPVSDSDNSDNSEDDEVKTTSVAVAAEATVADSDSDDYSASELDYSISARPVRLSKATAERLESEVIENVARSKANKNAKPAEFQSVIGAILHGPVNVAMIFKEHGVAESENDSDADADADDESGGSDDDSDSDGKKKSKKASKKEKAQAAPKKRTGTAQAPKDGKWILSQELKVLRVIQKFMADNELGVEDFVAKYILKRAASNIVRGSTTREGTTTPVPPTRIISVTNKQRDEFWKLLHKVVPERDLQSIRMHVTRVLDPNNYTGDWTKEEDDKLNNYVNSHGPKWKLIALHMQKSEYAVRDRYRYIRHNDRTVQGAFSADEDNRIMEAVLDATVNVGRSIHDTIPWDKVSEEVETRNPTACRKRWETTLLSRYRTGGERIHWTEEGMRLLIKWVYDLGVEHEKDIRWDGIKKLPRDSELQLFGAQKCRMKFVQMKAAVPDHDKKPLDDILDHYIGRISDDSDPNYRAKRLTSNGDDDDDDDDGGIRVLEKAKKRPKAFRGF